MRASISGVQVKNENLTQNFTLYFIILERPGVNFINVLRTAFVLVDPKIVKDTVESLVSFYGFGIYECKRCT